MRLINKISGRKLVLRVGKPNNKLKLTLISTHAEIKKKEGNEDVIATADSKKKTKT